MPKTHDIGPLFVHNIALHPASPILHRATTWETDFPFRTSKSLVLRFWGERGVVLGWWKKSGETEDSALMNAMGAREYEMDDFYA